MKIKILLLTSLVISACTNDGVETIEYEAKAIPSNPNNQKIPLNKIIRPYKGINQISTDGENNTLNRPRQTPYGTQNLSDSSSDALPLRRERRQREYRREQIEFQNKIKKNKIR